MPIMDREYYFSVRCSEASSIQEATALYRKKLSDLLNSNNLSWDSIILIRFFCSDVYNQASVLEKLWPSEQLCQRVYIGQQPLDSAYISLQAYCIGAKVEKSLLHPGALRIAHGAYESLWCLDYPEKTASSERQTDEILRSVQRKLAVNGMRLDTDVIRTWYYLRDVDNNYSGMIKSRVLHYEACGLIPENHFIASTGIEGCSPRSNALVALQTHAIKNLAPEQVTYLKALDNLSPTHVYGVNFERATKINYGDRAHCHISGTASIDKDGNAVHKGNVRRQTERALENIDALLLEGGMNMSQLRAATVYLRDAQDYGLVQEQLKDALPFDCAVNITRASVCRPDWLVEIEGEAIVEEKLPYGSYL